MASTAWFHGQGKFHKLTLQTLELLLQTHSGNRAIEFNGDATPNYNYPMHRMTELQILHDNAIEHSEITANTKQKFN